MAVGEFLTVISMALVRHAATALAGAMVAHGLITESAQDQIIGYITAGAALMWSWLQKLGRDGIAATLRAIADTIDKKAVAAAAALALAFAVCMPGDAEAGPRSRAAKRGFVSDLVSSDILSQVSSASLTDLHFAIAIARAANTPGSLMRAKCYEAWSDLIAAQAGTGAGAAGVQLEAAGTTRGPLATAAVVFTSAERLAQFADAMQPASPFMQACSPVAAQIKTNVAGLVGRLLKGGLTLALFGL